MSTAFVAAYLVMSFFVLVGIKGVRVDRSFWTSLSIALSWPLALALCIGAYVANDDGWFPGQRRKGEAVDHAE